MTERCRMCGALASDRIVTMDEGVTVAIDYYCERCIAVMWDQLAQRQRDAARDATERAERLAEVDAWLADLEPGCDGWYIPTRLVRWLRDEVERYREIAQAVATFDDDDSYDGAYKCHWCAAMYDDVDGMPAPHAADCPVTKARALLTD